MKSSQISIEDKQIFLRNQILQGGLDAESFMDYMGTVKKQGQNIDLQKWSMQELKNVVKDFKHQIKADADALKKVEQSQFRQSQQLFNQILTSLIQKKQKVFYQKGLWDYQIINIQNCKKQQKIFNFNSKIQPKVHITKWQVRTHGGFFLGFGATKQLWVQIQTNFTPKSIERTNNDLQWFRNILVKKYSTYYIPPLPQLRYVQAQDKIGLNNRVKLMEQFLNTIIKFEYLIQNNISKQFFLQTDHSKFTNFKNKQKNIQSTKDLGRISTLQGTLQLQISQKNQKKIKNCSGFSKAVYETYSQIDIQIKKILSDMQSLSKHVLYVSNSCGILNQKYSKICNLNQINTISMQTIMIYLNNVFSNIGKNIKDQMKVIKQFSDDFNQFTIKTWEQFNNFDKRYQKQVQNYLNIKLQLIRKKQRTFQDFNKWQLTSQQQYKKVAKMDLTALSKDQIFTMMFPRQNKQQQSLRFWIAYLNKTYLKSFDLILKQQQNQIKQKFKIFIQHSKKVSDQNYIAFNQFNQILMSNPNQQKQKIKKNY